MNWWLWFPLIWIAVSFPLAIFAGRFIAVGMGSHDEPDNAEADHQPARRDQHRKPHLYLVHR